MSTMWWLPLIYLFLLTNPTLGLKNGNDSKAIKANNKKENILNNNFSENRIKRSLRSEDEKIFTPMSTKLIVYDLNGNKGKLYPDLEQPFWGMRGRRESSEENYSNINKQTDDYLKENCKNCFKILFDKIGSSEEILSPFWGNRGRRNSDEVEDNAGPENPFWGNRGRREEDEPFWGTRGRREHELPFWGNRGRRGDIQLKNEKNADSQILKNRDSLEPFWGNRGRRKIGKTILQHIMQEETEPFWGIRGRRKDHKANEINEQSDYFKEDRERRKTLLKQSIINAVNKAENDNEKFSRLRRSNNIKKLFWSNRGRENKLQHLFTGVIGNKLQSKLSTMDTTVNFKPSEPETVLDDRIFAEQPHYILVGRSSPLSLKDPLSISREKIFGDKTDAANRDRRGAIEELVKSVKNDPYYITRGKKSVDMNDDNSLITEDKFEKAVEMICSTIELLSINETNHKVNGEIKDNERDRRNTLKNIAVQLHDDPYFLSRGKRNVTPGTSGQDVEELINRVSIMCN